jgi:hypothetical protein
MPTDGRIYVIMRCYFRSFAVKVVELTGSADYAALLV